MATRLGVLLAILALVSCGDYSNDDPLQSGIPPEFKIDEFTPEQDAILRTFPQQVRISFSRTVDASTVTNQNFTVIGANGDGNFNGQNEFTLIPDSIGTSGGEVVMDFSSSTPPDDDYRIEVRGTGAGAVADTQGTLLGSDARSDFTVRATAPDPNSLSQIQQDIFTPDCTGSGCHSGGTPGAGLLLTQNRSYGNLVNAFSTESATGALRVVPGDADNSYLVQRMEGTTAASNQRHPEGDPPSNADISRIRTWITEGALDN